MKLANVAKEDTGYAVVLHPPDDPDFFMVLYRATDKPSAELYCNAVNQNLDECMKIARREGAKEMREAAAQYVEDADDGVPLQMLADDGIRALPLPGEEKP